MRWYFVNSHLLFTVNYKKNMQQCRKLYHFTRDREMRSQMLDEPFEKLILGVSKSIPFKCLLGCVHQCNCCCNYCYYHCCYCCRRSIQLSMMLPLHFSVHLFQSGVFSSTTLAYESQFFCELSILFCLLLQPHSAQWEKLEKKAIKCYVF